MTNTRCNVLIIYINYLFYYYFVIGCILVKYAICLSGDHVRLKFGELGLLDRWLDSQLTQAQFSRFSSSQTKTLVVFYPKLSSIQILQYFQKFKLDYNSYSHLLFIQQHTLLFFYTTLSLSSNFSLGYHFGPWQQGFQTVSLNR